ncbi:hypothetical protein, partial [Xanthomonas citri]|uniref:hypothetical protein n=1 Tax=Xanthomonas citri TaxID=346 RepID=UPI001CA511D6
CPSPQRHRTSAAWMNPLHKAIVSRICGELIRPSLRANLVFRLIATITVAENQSLTHDGSNLGGDQKPMEELFRTSLRTQFSTLGKL